MDALKATGSYKGCDEGRYARMSWIWADLRTRRPLGHGFANHICFLIFPRILTPTGRTNKAKNHHKPLADNVTA